MWILLWIISKWFQLRVLQDVQLVSHQSARPLQPLVSFVNASAAVLNACPAILHNSLPAKIWKNTKPKNFPICIKIIQKHSPPSLQKAKTRFLIIFLCFQEWGQIPAGAGKRSYDKIQEMPVFQYSKYFPNTFFQHYIRMQSFRTCFLQI